jgi:hypothetical protein
MENIKLIMLLLLCSLSAQAQGLNPIVGGVYLCQDTIVAFDPNKCGVFGVTSGYIMNTPLSVGGRDLFITAETHTFRPNEYRDFTPQQKPSTIRKFRTVASTYKITRTKMFAWSLIAVGGAADGLLEGYLHDGRTSFDRKWNASKTGFWGSESWRSVYVGGDPENGFKSGFIKWTGANDFYHFADDTRKIGYITGGVILGIGTKANTKWWHYAADFGISFAASAISKSAAYYYIRN